MPYHQYYNSPPYQYQYQPPPVVPCDINQRLVYVPPQRGHTQSQRVLIVDKPKECSDSSSSGYRSRRRYYRERSESSVSSSGSSPGYSTTSSTSVKGIFWNAIKRLGDRFYGNLNINQYDDEQSQHLRYVRYPRYDYERYPTYPRYVRYTRPQSPSSSSESNSRDSDTWSASSSDKSVDHSGQPKCLRKGVPREMMYRKKYRRRRDERRMGFWEKIFGY